MSKTQVNQLPPYEEKDYNIEIADGDGDCAYHAILNSLKTLYPEISVPSTTTKLRKLMLTRIENDISLFPVSLHGESNIKRNERNEVINRITIGIHDLGNPRSYAQNDELTIIANLYNICIAVWSEFMELWIYITPNTIDDSLLGLEGCYKTIYLFNTSVEKNKCDGDGDTDLIEFYGRHNTCGIHYNYLIPKERTANNVSTKKDSVSTKKDSVLNNNNDDDNDDNDNDNDMIIDNKEIEEIKKASLKKRFKYFKEKIEKLNESTNFKSEINVILNTALLMKADNKRHRLTERPEYFINQDDTEINIKNGFFYTKKQKFLKKFLSIDTNNRAILLFHDVGVGKTCSSILIAENFVNIFDKTVLVLLPSSLENNYKKELFDITKLNYTNRTYDACSGQRFLKNLPDWYKMSRHEVNKRVQTMIKQDYSFYGYLKIVNVVEKIKTKALKKYPTNQDLRMQYEFWTIRETFSNRVIIIDEIHNIRISNEKSMKKFPKVLKKILKFSENIRLVLLSATPMFDKPDEFSWIMDFIYTADKEYKSYGTNIEYDTDSNTLTDDSAKKIKYFAKNYVSYMHGYNPETFPFKYFVNVEMNEKYEPKLDMITKEPIVGNFEKGNYEFIYTKMKPNQQKIYEKYMNSSSNSESNIQQTIQLSNIIYPNKNNEILYGQSGFTENFRINDTQKQLTLSYIDKDKKPFLAFENIQDYSSKMYSILKNIKSSTGLIIVYSRYLYSGIIPLGIALEHMGYSKYKSVNLLSDKTKTQKQKDLNYIVLTGDEKFSANNEEELQVFNSDDNIRGSKIKVALINDIAAEGVTFKNVREIHILEPWYNMYKIEQIIGRGVRYMSHEKLPEQERNVGIFMYINTISNNDIESVDYRRYRHALQKQDKIRQIEYVLKSNSLDCNLNSSNNQKIKKSFIDSKGETKESEVNFENVICQTKLDKNTSKTYNKRMLIFDIIELSKKVKYIVEKEQLYEFDYDLMFEKTKSELLKSTLHYMIRKKNIIILKETQGYLIEINDKGKYIFQPLEIDDIKLSVHDRKKDKTKYIKRYLVTPVNKTDSDLKNESDELEKLIMNRYIEYKNNLFSKQVSYDINDQIIIDMSVDHVLTANNVLDILSINNNDIINSLINGNILINQNQDKVIYNFFTKKSYTVINEDTKQLGIKHNQLIEKSIIEKLEGTKNRMIYGFIDISKKETTVTKIFHKDPNIKSSGSACIATSSFKVPMLQEYISNIDRDLILTDLAKKNLCLLYEYVLRKNNMFKRPVEKVLL